MIFGDAPSRYLPNRACVGVFESYPIQKTLSMDLKYGFEIFALRGETPDPAKFTMPCMGA
jgi:hypothetical protein